jgi:hypothetical protein
MSSKYQEVENLWILYSHLHRPLHAPSTFLENLLNMLQTLQYIFDILVSSLHLKYKINVDSSIQDFSINIDNKSVCRVHKTTNWVYQRLKSTLGPALLVYSPPKKSTSRMA